MNSFVYFVITISCGLVCLLGGFDFTIRAVTTPIIVAISGYSVLGPGFAARARGIELIGMYLGTSIGTSILIGIGLSRLGIAVSSQTMFLSYAVVFGLAALAWAVAGRTRPSELDEVSPPGPMSLARLAGSSAVIVVSSAAALLLFSAAARDAPVTQLAVMPREPTDGLLYQPETRIELQAHVALPPSVSASAALVVTTNTGQSLVIELQPQTRAQTVPILISAPSRDSSGLLVTAVVQHDGVPISPEVRLNMRPIDL